MGAQSAKQWRCQAPLLLSKSSSHVFPKVGILQSNRRLLSGASWLCNAISRERRSCRRCALWPVSALPTGPGTRRARNWSCASGAAELGGHGGWPGRGAGAVSQHPVSQTKANSWAWRKFLRAGEDMLPLPQLPSLGNVRAINRAIAPDRCWSLLLNQSDFMGCFAIFFNVVFFFFIPPTLKLGGEHSLELWLHMHRPWGSGHFSTTCWSPSGHWVCPTAAVLNKQRRKKSCWLIVTDEIIVTAFCQWSSLSITNILD